MDSNPNAPLPRPDAPQLRCLLLCDLADSTALIEKLGDARAAELMRRHDRVARDTLQRFHGQEIDKTDGFLLLFERPIEAVRFALAYQRSLRELGSSVGHPLRARVGIHVGEILTWRNAADAIAGGAKPVEVEGLAKAIAARLMGLAQAGQILLSESAFSLAQRARAELDDPATARWLDHGRYRLKGVARAMHVFEVGNNGIAPLVPPANSAKAQQIRPWYYWKPLYAAAAFGAALLPLWWLLKPTPAIAFAERDWLVVADVRNLTGNPLLDDSLDTAIRIGLGQSRHVNLVTTSRTSEVLQLMQRDPESPLDRSVSSEIAQRIGARAVLLPSVADVGGRFRVTAELIDPRTETTVYSHSNDAVTPDDVLPALDNVLADVRSDLGELGSDFDSRSDALSQVTTSSLRALRAYTLAKIAKSEQRLDDAGALLDEALALDPQFAMAYLAKVGLALINNDFEAAEQNLRRAAADVDRLSQRERLFVDATRGLGAPTDRMLAGWRKFVDLYPDDPRAVYNLTYFSISLANDCSEVVKLSWNRDTEALMERAHRAFESATCLLMQGQLDAAERAFLDADDLGLRGNGVEYAQLRAVQGDFVRAQQILDKDNDSRPPDEREQVANARVGLELFHGDWNAVQEQSQLLAEHLDEFTPNGQAISKLTLLTLSMYSGKLHNTQALTDLFESRLASAESGTGIVSIMDTGLALVAAWLQVRNGHMAKPLHMDRLRALVLKVDQAPLNSLLNCIEAEHLLQAGDADLALAKVDEGKASTAPYLRASVRTRALLALGRINDARAECETLQNSAGRALAERVATGSLQAVNLLERAVAPLAFNDSDGSDICNPTRARQFLQGWPLSEAIQPPLRGSYSSG